MSSDDEARYGAMVEFLGCFPTLSSDPPEDLADLCDGVVLFEALSEIAPDYFDPTTIARHLGDNWALKSSNLRKLLRNLERFYNEGLGKTADFESLDVSEIARNSDRAAIAEVFELVAAAAVTCENNEEFVGHILGMSPDNQIQMKGIIESSLSRLSELDDDDEDEDEDDDNDSDAEHEMEFDPATPGTTDAPSSGLFAKSSEREELEQALMAARRELAAHKSQASILAEDNENAQKKLKVLVEDLQDRLVKRQEELINAEEELQKKTTALEDAMAKSTDLAEKNSQLADDLDVANAKAMQLRKAEATVMAYRNKLEGVGVMNQQMTELEDQSASYLRQIMDLEASTKKIPSMQKNIEELQGQVAKLEKEKAEASSAVVAKTSEVADLKSKLSAADNAKKMYEEELEELRVQQEGGVSVEDDLGSAAAGLSLTSSKSVAEAKEKAVRLDIENKNLREEIEKLKNQSTAAGGTVASVASNTNDAGTSNEIVRLKEELAKMGAEKKKIEGDKDKLEAYTKKTLAKFQEKYLVALQECKAKLKEKQDKIEALESRSASEKSAQKREERLLSSTIYELGLAVMQNRLKER